MAQDVLCDHEWYQFRDAATGRVLRIRNPLHAPAGDAFLDWEYPLDTGEAFGTAGRVGITVAALEPAAFLVTDLAVWWQRRHGRRGVQAVPAGSPDCLASTSVAASDASGR
jgi:uncharacterized iron-regulated membrane protein